MGKPSKNPDAVRLGRLARDKRWGVDHVPRVFRAEDLSHEQRQLVQALINAERAKNEKAAAATERTATTEETDDAASTSAVR